MAETVLLVKTAHTFGPLHQRNKKKKRPRGRARTELAAVRGALRPRCFRRSGTLELKLKMELMRVAAGAGGVVVVRCGIVVMAWPRRHTAECIM